MTDDSLLFSRAEAACGERDWGRKRDRKMALRISLKTFKVMRFHDAQEVLLYARRGINNIPCMR